jgi:DNA-binding CsgD family transcriptional regulator
MQRAALKPRTGSRYPPGEHGYLSIFTGPELVCFMNRPVLPLSERQLDCLKFVAAGLSSPKIARRLGISPRTVDEYVADACLKLGVRTRVEAIAVAIRAGLI